MTAKTAAPSQPLALTDAFKTALVLVEESFAIKTITTAEQFEDAKVKYKTLIEQEKRLDEQYNELEVIKQAKQAQAQKKELADKFAAAKKYLKNTPMLAFERAEEEKRLAEERRLAEIARKEEEAETARQLAEQKKAFDLAEKERKAAEAKAAKAKGEEAKAKALQDAKEAAARAEQARLDAQTIKADAAAAPAAVVVVEKTAPSVARNTVYRWRLTTKDGRKFTKDDFKKVLRLRPDELPAGWATNLFVLDHTAVSAIVDSQGKNVNIPGLEVWTETV